MKDKKLRKVLGVTDDNFVAVGQSGWLEQYTSSIRDLREKVNLILEHLNLYASKDMHLKKKGGAIAEKEEVKR